jgi:SAM-dependent methyltransferase
MPTPRRTLAEFQRNADAWATFKATAGVAAKLIEEPVVFRKDLYPDTDVLCVGCGSAEECETALCMGAARVIGVDRCMELLNRGAGTKAPLCAMDIENLAFRKSAFDLILCRFVAHYLDSWVPFLREIKRILRPNGTCVISVYHPLYLAMDEVKTGDQTERWLGYSSQGGSNTFAVLGDYLKPRWITRFLRLGEKGPVLTLSLYAKPISAIMNDIAAAGLTVKAIHEPAAGEDASSIDLPLYQVHSRIPLFLIIEVGRSDTDHQS